MNTVKVKNKKVSNNSPQEGDIYYATWNEPSECGSWDYFIVARCSENTFVAISLDDGCRWSNPTENIKDCIAPSGEYDLKFLGRNVKVSIELNDE